MRIERGRLLSSTYSAVQRKHAATSRLADKADDLCKIVRVHAAQEPFGNLERDLPSPNAISCSREVSALRMPPLGTVRDEIERLPSNSTSSLTQIAPRRDTMASAEMRRKSNRWQREWMVSGTFWGSVVARMNTTWLGGSSSVFNSALNAAVDSM